MMGYSHPHLHQIPRVTWAPSPRRWALGGDVHVPSVMHKVSDAYWMGT